MHLQRRLHQRLLYRGAGRIHLHADLHGRLSRRLRLRGREHRSGRSLHLRTPARPQLPALLIGPPMLGRPLRRVWRRQLLPGTLRGLPVQGKLHLPEGPGAGGTRGPLHARFRHLRVRPRQHRPRKGVQGQNRSQHLLWHSILRDHRLGRMPAPRRRLRRQRQ